MSAARVWLLTVFAACVAATATAGEPLAQPRPSGPDNAELRAIFTDDQADRARPIGDDDWPALNARDRVRRDRVLDLLRGGLVRTAADHGHAAMVFQHSADDIRLAHALATIATTLEPHETRYRWLVAASWDRMMMQHVQPQWYGTQYQADEAGGMFRYPVAVNAVTDAERLALGVPTLAEATASLAGLATSIGQAPRSTAPTIEELQARSDRYGSVTPTHVSEADPVED